MNKILILLGLLFALILTACGGGETAVVSDKAAEPAAVGETSNVSRVNNGAAQVGDSVRLSEDYKDALPVQAQLAIGILRLENGDYAVDEAMAAELLPLWRAAQSLANSETAAEAEVTAVLNQIQDTMSAEQVVAIAAMQITQESFDEMLANGEISMGRGTFGGGQGSSEEGDFARGGLGGGMMPGGGPGGGLAGLGGDPSAMETRMAERGIEGGVEELQANAITNAVIRLLEAKTGELSTDLGFGGGLMGDAITAVSEATGLSEEDIQAATNDGKTLAEIVEENGGDLEAVKAFLAETLADSNFLQDHDPNEFITNFLEGSVLGRPTGNE